MKIVIIGNGVAGISAAETVRAADKNCAIRIFCDEPGPYYSRPRLVECLAGKATADQIVIHPRAWYEKNQIALIESTRIVALDTALKRVTDSHGQIHDFDRLIIATGALSKIPPIPGSDLENVFSLRTLAEAMAIKQAAATAKQAVVIGGGLQGIEIAYSLQTLGVETLIIELADRLLPQQLDEDASSILRLRLGTARMRFLTGARVQTITRTERSLAVQLQGSGAVMADCIVFSTGIRPDLTLVAGTPVNCRRGIIIDPFMRTSVDGIYACGDCAEYNGTVYGLWPASREQGIVAGNHIVGKETPYQGSIAATRLKVAGVEAASIGDISGIDAEAADTARDEAAGTYRKIFAREGKIIGAILIGNVKEAVKLQQMIKAGETFLRS
jgi:nitrite reductase (NADH) large subunit